MGESTLVTPEGDLQKGPDVLLEKIKAYILKNYLPVKNPIEATTTMSTDEIYSSIRRLYPHVAFTTSELVIWLTEQGFDFYDAGQMRFEWMLKSAT